MGLWVGLGDERKCLTPWEGNLRYEPAHQVELGRKYAFFGMIKVLPFPFVLPAPPTPVPRHGGNHHLLVTSSHLLDQSPVQNPFG